MRDPMTLPARRTDLVSWRNNGHYVVRNRKTGESFQLGEEERFLLERLDGRRRPEEIQEEYRRRFARSLSEKELREFVGLATERALLQEGDGSPGPLAQAKQTAARRPLWKRCAVRLLNVLSTALQWTTWPAGVVPAGICHSSLMPSA